MNNKCDKVWHRKLSKENEIEMNRLSALTSNEPQNFMLRFLNFFLCAEREKEEEKETFS